MDTNTPLADHDLLVRLDTKVDGLTQSFQDFHLSLAARVLKTETRLDAIDIYHAAIPLAQYQQAYEWVTKFKNNLTFTVAVGGAMMALLGGVISAILVRWLQI